MTMERNNNNTYILSYTRKPKDDLIYSPKLAYSMHLAYSDDGINFQDLNHNSGVLFAKATENEDGSLNAKSLKNPYIFYLDDGNFGVVAVRTEAGGNNDQESKGKVVLFTSTDLLQYEELGLIDLNGNKYIDDVICFYDEKKGVYVIKWCDEDGNYYQNFIEDIFDFNTVSEAEEIESFNREEIAADIEGIVPGNIIEISEEKAERLRLKLTVPNNVKIELPDTVIVSSKEDLEAVKATAIYSDGTKARKKVDWGFDTIDWSNPGKYQIKGKVHQDHFSFPIATNRADPAIGRWNGKYYFIATNDADGNNSLYIREADSIPELLEAEENLILDTKTYEDIKGLLWAPEFHIIDGELYIFHGATVNGEFFYEESHVMKLKKGGNPINKEDWSRPYRVVKKDGSYLCEAGKTISLDMTYFNVKQDHYVVWSQRQFLPEDLGAWLYIAKIDPAEPWKLTNDPVVLSKPEYGWANNNVFVDEGAFALFRDNKLFLTFASALIDATYVVGLLTTEVDADLMDPSNWTKTNYPLLTSRSVPGEYGPGHNSYVIDDEGDIWNAYHARPGVDAPRCSGLRRVHFDIDGYPRLDLTEDKDLNKDIAEVSIDIVIE
ncbi:family 43 glycosylhydrolase [Natronospora cellulosivora (SeqCode)]